MARHRLSTLLRGLADRLDGGTPHRSGGFGGGFTGAVPTKPAVRLFVDEGTINHYAVAKSLRETLDRLKDEKR